MNNDSKELVKEYISLLKKNIEKITNQLDSLKNHELDEKEFALYEILNNKLLKYQKSLKDFSNLMVFDEMKEKLDVLGKSKTLKKDKEDIKKYIMNVISWYKDIDITIDGENVTINNDNIDTYITEVKGKIERLNPILDVLYDKDEKDFAKELKNKLSDLEVLKKYNSDTTKLKEEIRYLQTAIEIIKTYDTSKVEKELNSLIETKKQLEELKLTIPNMDSIDEHLYLIGDRNITKEEKESLIAKLKKYITLIEDDEFKHIDNDLNLEFIELEIKKLKKELSNKDTDKNTEKELEEEMTEEKETKDSKKEGFLEKNKRKICGVLIGALAITAAGFGLYHLSRKGYSDRNKDKFTYTDPTPMPTEEVILEEAPEATSEPMPTEDTLENKLMNIGYSYETASLIPTYFDEVTINRLLNIPYDLRVEAYANVSGFNYDYIREYEEIRHLFNLTSNKTVDYVNRAHILKDYNFLDNDELADYVAFVNAIDNKALFRNEFVEANNRLNDITNTVASHVMDSLVMGTNAITADDINKINALTFIAPDGSDLDMCISKFVEIVTSIINDPNNMELREQAFKFIQIFITSANDFNNTLNYEVLIPDSEKDENAITNVLTGDAAFDEAAKVLDDADWYMAYDGVIKRLVPVVIPTGDGEDVDYQRWDDLLFTGENHLDAIRGQICGEGLVLTQEGGEF